MAIPKPKPPRKQKKEPKPLKRSPIKRGRRCPECGGSGTKSSWEKSSSHEGMHMVFSTCLVCVGTGRIASKPIKKSTKSIKRNVDLAAFDINVTASIWVPFVCPLTGLVAGNAANILIDQQHILGRGRGDYMFSSPYNCSPLCRLIHSYGNRDHRFIRAFLLERSRQQVDEAIRDGRYNPTDKERDRDAAFVEYSADFLPQFL